MKDNSPFGHKEPIRQKIFLDFSSARVKICEVHVSFKTTSQLLLNICVTIHCKLIHFLLWTKRSYQSSNFDTFKCSDENLQNSSCHFPSNKAVFLQIFHHSSVS